MKRRQRRAREFYFRSEKDRLPTTNGASPLDNMRSLEHYLNDLMRSQGTSNGEPPELKGKAHVLLSTLNSWYNHGLLEPTVNEVFAPWDLNLLIKGKGYNCDSSYDRRTPSFFLMLPFSPKAAKLRELFANAGVMEQEAARMMKIFRAFGGACREKIWTGAMPGFYLIEQRKNVKR
ncbi:Hypothetical predicted protein [Cloeon dipterum]|uniref:Uncharacterized protein n=1 Tax=Cloeon dipterum TaxID=197152 RepID=A0A8S1DW57_9INSE|nr:Hypothetical predicted protein [Cloeon dipterum]